VSGLGRLFVLGDNFVKGLPFGEQLGISLFQFLKLLLGAVMPTANPGKAANKYQHLKNCCEAKQSRNKPANNTQKAAMIPRKPKATKPDCTRRQENDEEFYYYVQHLGFFRTLTIETNGVEQGKD
jgi:hypothetical protein